MLRPIDHYFMEKEEPDKSCLDYLRNYIVNFDEGISEEWKYSMPMYYYRGKMFCYLWIHKKLHLPYIGIVEGRRINHPDLVMEKRARMKILLIDPKKNIPVGKINSILKQALKLYQA